MGNGVIAVLAGALFWLHCGQDGCVVDFLSVSVGFAVMDGLLGGSLAVLGFRRETAEASFLAIVELLVTNSDAVVLYI